MVRSFRLARTPLSLGARANKPRSVLMLALAGFALWAAALPAAAAEDNLDTLLALLRRGEQLLLEAEARERRGESAEARRFAVEAEQVFKAAEARAPRDPRPLVAGGHAAVIASAQDRARDWLARYEALVPRGENDPEAHYLAAHIELKLADRPLASMDRLRRLLSAYPTFRPQQRDLLTYAAMHRQAEIHVREEDSENAASYLLSAMNIALRLGRTDMALTAEVNLGKVLQRANRHAEALGIFEGLERRYPKNALYVVQVASCLADMSRFEEAIQKYERALSLHQGSKKSATELKQIPLRLGNCMRLAGERTPDPKERAALFERAKVAFRTYIDVAPDDPLGWRWLGTFHLEQEELPYEAEPLLRKAWALDPYCPDPLRFLIQIHTHYPPPPDARTPEGEAAWLAPLEAWERSLAEGAEERKAALDARKRDLGTDGCN